MEFRQLKMFLAVAEVLNFTRAAEQLGYVQSNITTQIHSLEEELKTRLFERMGKRVILTPDGEKLLYYAKSILKLESEAFDALSGESTPHGTITIGVSESLCVFRLQPFFRDYNRRYPKVKLIIKLSSSEDFRLGLSEDLVDVAIFLDNKVEDHDLVSKILIPEPVVLVGPTGHMSIPKGCITPADLENEVLIHPQKGCSYRAKLESILEENNVRPLSTLELDSIEAIKQLVISGLGIALLPLVAVKSEIEQNLMIDLNWAGPEINMYTQIVYHKDKWLSPTLLSVLDMVNEQFGMINL